MKRQSNTNEVANWLTEFISTTIHTLLYLHEVYPRETFERIEKYGAVAYRCLIESVVQYLDHHMMDVQQGLSQSSFMCIKLSFYAQGSNPRKTYCWKIRYSNPLLSMDSFFRYQELYRKTLLRLVLCNKRDSFATFRLEMGIVDPQTRKPGWTPQTTLEQSIGSSIETIISYPIHHSSSKNDQVFELIEETTHLQS